MTVLAPGSRWKSRSPVALTTSDAVPSKTLFSAGTPLPMVRPACPLVGMQRLLRSSAPSCVLLVSEKKISSWYLADGSWPLLTQVLLMIWVLVLLVSRMQEPPLRKPMLLRKVAPVLPWSTMNPLPSEWFSEMSTFSKEIVCSTRFDSGPPWTAKRLTPLDQEGSWAPLCATIDCLMWSPPAQ